MNINKIEPLKLLVIGKTGVGKSAFCNFLFGQEVFESAAGIPVTEGIQEHQFKIEDTDIIIYDTEGIEISNASEWEGKLEKLIGNSYKNTEKIHGIFYLINSSSARIEDFEIDLIEQFSEKRNIPVFVILTHVDVASHNQIISIQNQLEIMKRINILTICSVQKNLRGGRTSLSNDSFKKYHFNLTTLFLETSGKYYLYDNVFTMLDTFKNTISKIEGEILKEISDAGLSVFNITEWEIKFEKITNRLENLLDSFQYQFDSMLEHLQDISCALAPHVKSNPFEDFILELSSNLDLDFDIDQITSIRNIQEDVDTLENENGFFSKLGSVFSLGYKTLTAESTIKDIVKDIAKQISIILLKNERKTYDMFNNESWVMRN